MIMTATASFEQMLAGDCGRSTQGRCTGHPHFPNFELALADPHLAASQYVHTTPATAEFEEGHTEATSVRSVHASDRAHMLPSHARHPRTHAPPDPSAPSSRELVSSPASRLPALILPLIQLPNSQSSNLPAGYRLNSSGSSFNLREPNKPRLTSSPTPTFDLSTAHRKIYTQSGVRPSAA